MQLKRGHEFRGLKRQEIKQVRRAIFRVAEIFGNAARALLGENLGELFDASEKEFRVFFGEGFILPGLLRAVMLLHPGRDGFVKKPTPGARETDRHSRLGL